MVVVEVVVVVVLVELLEASVNSKSKTVNFFKLNQKLKSSFNLRENSNFSEVVKISLSQV